MICYVLEGEYQYRQRKRTWNCEEGRAANREQEIIGQNGFQSYAVRIVHVAPSTKIV
jgi:hypothetical protein